MAEFVVEFPGGLVQMVAWGLNKVPKQFEEMFTKIDILSHCMVKSLFINFLLMLQLDEWQLLNSANQSLTGLERRKMRPADFI